MICGLYQVGDPVVLPSGAHAAVVGEVLGRVECRYLKAMHNDGRTVVLVPKLIRKIVNGIVPPPVRITWYGVRS